MIEVDGKHAASSQGAKLSEETFQKMRRYIYDKTGIYFLDNKRYLLEARLGKRLRQLGLSSYEEYYALLVGGGINRELPSMVNAITINETYFFRSTPQFELIEKQIIPELIQSKAQEGLSTIRIWSAACSSGEKAYTLAMIMQEHLRPLHPHIRFEIVGTDINSEVIEKARAGIYSSYSIRNVPAHLLSKYFMKKNGVYQLTDEARNWAQFKVLNFADHLGMKTMANFDIVICANALIYFDNESRGRVIALFYSNINNNGYLFLGPSESLFTLKHPLKPVRFETFTGYKKVAKAGS